MMMHWLKLPKFVNHLGFGFSKIKPIQLGTKLAGPGLKPAPTLKKPNLVPPTPKQLDKTLSKKIQATQAQDIEKQKEQGPIIKHKHPVVTIMGHVDHGKTTLIDYLRKSQIAQQEDGGITQRIGAFRINCIGQRITFIDTPGHQAFVNMRQRGASVTDLVVLIVSATEGVKKQTLQVIQLIKNMQIPVIVAITKIDLPQANPQQVESQLQKAGLRLQFNGGDVPVVHISAKTGTNVDLLCQLIIDQTKNATATFNGLTYASVLQANQTKQGLNAMTIIIQKGILKQNAILIIGNHSFRAKTIIDDRGQNLKEAFPGDAVRIVGIPYVPAPGDIVFEVENENKARSTLQQNKQKKYQKQRTSKKNQDTTSAAKIHFVKGRQGRRQKRAFCRGIREVWMNKFADEQEKILTKLQELRKLQGNQVVDMAIMELQEQLQVHTKYVYEYLRNTGDRSDTLNFIIKFQDRGMEETILMQLQKLKPSIEQQTKVKLNLIKTDVGDVTVSDLQEAKNCSAKIFTFGAGVSFEAKNHLQGLQPPRTHKLIHNLLKDIKQTSFNKKLSLIKGVQRGRCQIAQVYPIKMKKKQCLIPGVKVTVGKITKKCKGYIFRNGLPISQSLDISFIKSFKKEMLQLKRGQQGTIGFVQQTPNIQKGDHLAFYQQF